MAERRWLWEAADELLAAWCPPGSERTYTDAGGRAWTERGAAPDLEPFHRAYDQLLWEVVTSPPAGLAAFAARFYEEPYLPLLRPGRGGRSGGRHPSSDPVAGRLVSAGRTPRCSRPRPH